MVLMNSRLEGENIIYEDEVSDLKFRDRFNRLRRTIGLIILYILMIVLAGYMLGIIALFLTWIIITALFPKASIPTPDSYKITEKYVIYGRRTLRLGKGLKIKLDLERMRVLIISRYIAILQLYSHNPEQLKSILDNLIHI